MDPRRQAALLPSSKAALESALTEVIDAAIAISGADFGNVQLLDPATSDLKIVAQRGFPDFWLEYWDSVSAGQAACGTALELGRRVVVEDVLASPLFDATSAEIQRRAGVRGVQSTPMFTRSGIPVGVFSTHYRTPFRPDARTLLLLDLLARHTSDLIERMLADQSLRASEEKYATLFTHSPAAMALSRGGEGVMVDVNDAFSRLFGYEREAMIGRTKVGLGIGDQDVHDRALAALEADGWIRDFECSLVGKSGARRLFALEANRVGIEGQPHLLAQLVDITERREDELRRDQRAEELTELNRDLEVRVAERSEQLSHAWKGADAASQAKSAFLASMSHELRTPLNSILGFAELLRRDGKSPLSGVQQGRLDHVLKAGKLLLQLVDEVLDLAGIDAGGLTVSLEPVQVTVILAEVETILAPMASRMEIELVVEPPRPEVPAVSADPRRLVQILANYGSNAVKYGRRGGRATLSVEALGDGFVRVVVSDDGLGIPEAEQPKIFQPFERAGRESGTIAGTGVGLAICKRLADAMRGRVGFHSVATRGSSFWVDLPAHTAA